MKAIKPIFDFQKDFFRAAHGKSENLLNVVQIVDVVTKEAESPKGYPVWIKTDFGLLIGEIPALNLASQTFENFVAELKDDFRQLFDSRSFDDFNNNFAKLVQIEALRNLPDVVKGVIHMQVGLLLSFAAVIKNTEFDLDVYEDSFNQYFFSDKGYTTVSGDMVVRPRLPKKITDDSKTIGNQINAERYIRDITRIIVETSGDNMYKTRERYKRLQDKYAKDEAKEKLIAWFDSFGDMAEASLLPVVEEILNGALGAQLNPLIAAAVGTFCSVTARKATEHSYLTLLGIL
jgi:hypothetical protein